MFPCVLEMMRKALPGWEGMNFFKDLHSHRSFFFLWLAGKKQKRDFVAVFASCSFPSLEIFACVEPSPEISATSWRSKITGGKRMLLKIIPWASPLPPPVLWFIIQPGDAFLHLSPPHGDRAGEERLNASRAGMCVALPLPSAGGVRAHGRGGHGGSPGHGWAGRKVGRRAGTAASVCGKAFIPSLVWRRCCSLIGAGGKYNLPFPVNRIREMQI